MDVRKPNQRPARRMTPEEARARYRQRKAKLRRDMDNDVIDYNTYMQSVNRMEKIINIEEESQWETFQDLVDIFKEKVGLQKARLKQYLKRSTKKLVVRSAPAVTPLAQQVKKDPKYRIGAIFAILLLLVGASIVYGTRSDSPDVAGDVKGETSQRPQIVLEDTNTDQESQNLVFDPELGVASYSSEIDGIAVAITQQPLTTDQLNNKEESLAYIASQLGASTRFNSDKFGYVYLADGTPDNPEAQAALFMTKTLLIIIKSQQNGISAESFADYISKVRDN